MTTQVNQGTPNGAFLARVEKALDAAFDRASERESREGATSLDISSMRCIIFSDLHRGARNGADDFRRTERIYNAALAYYFRLGYTLVLLGDVEELWEERPKPVLGAHEYTINLEAQFHQQGRYIRIWGNHDDEWQYESRVKRHLVPLYNGTPLRVPESLKIRIVDGAQELGTLFLVHGHQGDAKSDQFSGISRLVVRYIWRPIQRLTHFSFNGPAKDWALREKYNIAMCRWAEKQEKLVLIAGHTHRPVFSSQSHEAEIAAKLELLEKELSSMPTREQLESLAILEAELEWIRAQEGQMPGREHSVPEAKPCYFNAGCCCFSDGDITGIEIADKGIRLVRWPDKAGEPEPHVLAEDSLEKVLSACSREVT